MVLVQNIHRSTKHIGKYEEKIIQDLSKHFQLDGYEVVPHSSLNIAWGSVLSDIDLLLIKDQLLTYIEVKSSRDNLARAKQQVANVSDYVDYAYVATDKQIKTWEMPKVGLIHVNNENVIIVKRAKKLSNKIGSYSIMTLKKKCLARFFGIDNRFIMLVDKYELAQNVYINKKCTRPILKEIVTCGELCATNCPIIQKES